MTPETRAQCEDAIRVLDAIIAARTAKENALNVRTIDLTVFDERIDARQAMQDAADQATHQIEMYRARYEHLR